MVGLTALVMPAVAVRTEIEAVEGVAKEVVGVKPGLLGVVRYYCYYVSS